VIAEGPCASIASGPGRVVTATVTHANDDVRTLTLDGGETLYVTGNHRMFSASAGDWVAVKDLGVGEELQTASGRKSVAALGYQKGQHQVYNIEVEAEHCYFVGEGQTLTHNGCVTDTANKKVPNPDGSNGKADHRAAVNDMIADFEKRYPPLKKATTCAQTKALNKKQD
jgi:hypothetical protein